MQSFHTCTKINDKNPKNQMPTMQNVCFLYFQYKRMKIQGLNNSLIYKSYCKKKKTNQAGYQEANIQPKMQAQPMKQK
jgi:hypothetical protein